MQTRKGFTLIEIVLALTILLVVMLALVTLTGKTVHVSATADRDQAAIQMATDRTDEVRANPAYTLLDSLFAGTESNFPTLPGFTRVTRIVRTTADDHDFRKVTVTVNGPGLVAPIVRTISVAAP